MSAREAQGRARFEHAISAAVRAMSGRREVSVRFGEPSDAGDATLVRLPASTAEPDASEIAGLRGEADSAALKLRHHDAELHRRNRPASSAAAAVFDALENVRYEALGARSLSGVAANLAARLEARCLAEGFVWIDDADRVPASTAFELLLRKEATGAPWPELADRLMSAWMQRVDPQARADLELLARSLGHQQAYAEAARRLMAGFSFEVDESGIVMVPSAASPAEAKGRGGVDMAMPWKEHADAGRLPAPVGPAEAAEEGADQAVRMPSSAADPGQLQRGVDEAGASRSAHDVAVSARSEATADPHAAAGSDASRRGAGIMRTPPYRAFTTEYDATVTPEQLCGPQQLLAWRSRLDNETMAYRAGMVRLAARLQRRLLARQSEAWDLELEDGILDTERLASSVADPGVAAVYKAQRKSDVPDTAFSILIDNSGSMGGLPIRLAAICADILLFALDRCGVKVEVLGFTTREWRGGRSREKWIRSGKPRHPGRLNDLCHIVYKTALSPWRRARRGIGVMLDESLLKENVDGEALLWAYRRLSRRPEQRRILMVLSDGAPVDVSTSSENPPGYLEQHLRHVIARIERERAVDLVAIGLGHDVRRYYRRAVKLDDPHALGEAIVGSVDALLR